MAKGPAAHEEGGKSAKRQKSPKAPAGEGGKAPPEEPLPEPEVEPRVPASELAPGPFRPTCPQDIDERPVKGCELQPPDCLGHLITMASRSQVRSCGKTTWINAVWYGYPMAYGVPDRPGALTVHVGVPHPLTLALSTASTALCLLPRVSRSRRE